MDKTYNLNGNFKPTSKRNVDLQGADFYPTPPWATYALIDNEHFSGDIWECACGDGAMSNVLALSGNSIESSELYNRGYGEVGIDFLTTNRRAKNIITNPPYNSAEGFVRKAVECTENKFALLLRLAFLEGVNRANGIFHENPPTRVWVFSERITFYPKNVEKKGSGTTAYAWFVWDKISTGISEIKWIKPGYKKMNVPTLPNYPEVSGLRNKTTCLRPV